MKYDVWVRSEPWTIMEDDEAVMWVVTDAICVYFQANGRFTVEDNLIGMPHFGDIWERLKVLA